MKYLLTYNENVSNTKKMQDNDGHWYWIPNELVDNFNSDLDIMSGKEYMEMPEFFDDFMDKYTKYETGGDEDLMPQFFDKVDDYLLQVYDDEEYTDINNYLWEEIQEEGFVEDLEDYYEEKYEIDDFEYLTLKISDEDKKGLMNFDDDVVEKFTTFDFELKKEQEPDYPTMVDFIDYDNGIVYIIRLI